MQRTEQKEQRTPEVTGYTRSDWRSIGLAGFTLVPLVLVVFFGVGAGSSVVIAIVAGLAIIAAAFFLSGQPKPWRRWSPNPSPWPSWPWLRSRQSTPLRSSWPAAARQSSPRQA